MKIYNRDHKTGRINKGHTIKSKEWLEQWFLERVLIIPFNECWEWIGYKRKGYGRFRGNNKKQISAHRFSYEMHNKKIPEGLVIDHICCNRGCVNPSHLQIVTSEQNCTLAAIRRRKFDKSEGLFTTKTKTVSAFSS